MARIEQKKSVIYFSSGMDRTGLENRAQLRNAINGAVSSNVSIYPMDSRGLQAMVPGGEAPQASMRGTSPYSGPPCATPSTPTSPARRRSPRWRRTPAGAPFWTPTTSARSLRSVQEDTWRTTCSATAAPNRARDGRFRHITVKTSAPGMKIDFRNGYYAPRDFAHSSREDREQQLRDELDSDPRPPIWTSSLRRLFPAG